MERLPAAAKILPQTAFPGVQHSSKAKIAPQQLMKQRTHFAHLLEKHPDRDTFFRIIFGIVWEVNTKAGFTIKKA